MYKDNTSYTLYYLGNIMEIMEKDIMDKKF